jgi:putative redox protein
MPITTRRGSGPLRYDIRAGDHWFSADAPVDLGGENSAPGPHDYLDAALAACTSITLQMYAARKNIPLQGVLVNITHEEGKGFYKLDRKIQLVGELSDEQRQDLLRVAERCPIHKVLTGEISITTALEQP